MVTVLKLLFMMFSQENLNTPPDWPKAPVFISLTVRVWKGL